MSRKTVYIALACAVLLAAVGIGYYVSRSPRRPLADSTASTASATEPTATATPSGQLPDPIILVIDRNAIMGASNVGQDVNRQMQALASQAKNTLDQQANALQNEGKDMQARLAVMAPDAKQKMIANFESRQTALREAAMRKDEELKADMAKANVAIEQALGPILQQVTKDHGANLILDKQAVLTSSNSAVDVTGEVIKKLNEKLPAYKIVPAPGK